MRIKISFTHSFNLIQKIVIYPISLISGILPAVFIGESSSNGFVQFLSIVVFIIVTGFVGFGLNNLLDPISTRLYLFFYCKTKVTYFEGKNISFLFNGSISGKWYPFSMLKDIPEEYRKQVVFEFADRIGGINNKKQNKTTRDENKQEDPNSSYKQKESTVNNEPQYTKEYIQACRILDINLNHSKEELKSKYRKQMLKYHPDLYANADAAIKSFVEDKARIINNAYEYLENYKG